MGRNVEDTHWTILVRHRIKTAPKAVLAGEMDGIFPLRVNAELAVKGSKH